MKRAAKFLLTTLIWALILITLVTVLYYLNSLFHLWEKPVDDINKTLNEVNKLFFTKMTAGLTIGSIFMVLFFIILPFISKNINTNDYMKSLFLGIVSSFVFFLSDSLYELMAKYGKMYVIISMGIAIFITVILIEVISLTTKSKRKENDIRTNIVSGIASGLIFSILLNVIYFLIDFIKLKLS